TLVVHSFDGTATQSIVVNITGANDNAAISVVAGGDDAVTEDGGASNGTPGDPSAAGQLHVTDVDSGEAHFATPPSLAGTYGTFTFDTTTGALTYTPAHAKAAPPLHDALPIYTLVVHSFDGTATQSIVVNITGANDNAAISVV